MALEGLVFMSCSSGAGVLVKFSKLFVKRIHRWGFVNMSTVRKHSGSNGRLPENSKLKKAKESLHGRFRVARWIRKLLSLVILGLLVTGCIWFLSSFSLWRTDDGTSDSCDKKAQIFLQHANVSSHQLHALATLFSDLDQVLLIFLLPTFLCLYWLCITVPGHVSSLKKVTIDKDCFCI